MRGKIPNARSALCGVIWRETSHWYPGDTNSMLNEASVMNERELFLAALDLQHPADRRAYLQNICAANVDLLARVESLLASHEGQSRFLNTPALEQLREQAEAVATPGFAKAIELDAAAAIAGGSDGMKAGDGDRDDELPWQYLRPSSRPGSLGRFAHYDVLETLGRGAFGVVLKAFDENLQRVVAIKVLTPELAATSPARKRFLREARSSAAVRHENVVSIYAVENDPIPYLVMEYVPGQTLQQRLNERGPLDLPDVLRLGKQIAYGLDAAHRQGLIHRDIKPSNILLEDGVDERVKITDFGLARTADDASITQSGIIAGTPMYMAPEQVQGRQLDQRADLFSLGSVLYQMLSGRPPFRAATTVAVLKRVAEDAPRPIREIIPDVPDWICRLIGHLHAKAPDDRYSSAKDVGDTLAQCLADVQDGRKPRIQAPWRSAGNSTAKATGKRPNGAGRLTRRPLLTAAVVAFMSLVGLGATEATGVTKLAATVVRLTTGRGTLVIESDDPELRIAIDGDEVTVRGGSVQELTLRPGEHKVAAVKDGQALKQELVTVTRNGRTVLRMSLESDGAVSKSPDVSISPDVPARLTSPPAAEAPFDAKHAKEYQQAWAESLGRPIEYTNSVGMSFVIIPPGEFTAGADPREMEEALRHADNPHWRQCVAGGSPAHKVILTRAIYFGVHEVTQEQYTQVMGRNPSHFSASGADQSEAERRPVDSVSWVDAAEFCVKLSELEKLQPLYAVDGETVSMLAGTGYRLPTEAEWEFACRAGTMTKYWTGSDDQGVLQAGWLPAISQRGTHAVGQLEGNAFGVFDTHGNVWEWVQDRWGPHYYAQFAERAAVDPLGPPAGDYRVLRGGSWFHHVSLCRSAARLYDHPTNRNNQMGIRVVLTIAAATKPGREK